MSIHFKWFDLWIGVFVERNDPDHPTVLYVCPLPMLVIRIPIGARG